MDTWQEFNDPVYGTVIFRYPRAKLHMIWDELCPTDENVQGRVYGNLADAFRSIFSSIEFTRLGHLKQAGLTFLEFPSAVHTRFAHSWGCLYLADRALSLITIKELSRRGSHEKSLDDFLGTYINEFLLALLLHDVGHMPFSHLLEDNEFFAGTCHEEIACQYILGEGEYYQQMRHKVNSLWDAKKPDDVIFLHETLNQIRDLDKGLLCALISGKRDYLDIPGVHSSSDRKFRGTVFAILKELVSGLLDLDRVDHYQRDVYFTGLRIPTPDPVSIMTNMLLCFTESNGVPQCEIRLDDMGVVQARNLLQAKSILMKHVFYGNNILAFHTMLRYATSEYIDAKASSPDKRSSLMKEIAIMTDEELMLVLLNCGIKNIRNMTRRIYSRIPYHLAGRFVLASDHLLQDTSELDRRKTLCIERLVADGVQNIAEDDVLFAPPSGFYRGKSRKKDGWLALDCLSDLDGTKILMHPHYKSDFEPFAREARENVQVLHVYVSRKDLIDAVGSMIAGNGILHYI